MRNKTSPETTCVMSGQPVVPDQTGIHTDIGLVHRTEITTYRNMMNTIWHGLAGERCDVSKASRKIAKRHTRGGMTVSDAIDDYRAQRRATLNGKKR